MFLMPLSPMLVLMLAPLLLRHRAERETMLASFAAIVMLPQLFWKVLAPPTRVNVPLLLLTP